MYVRQVRVPKGRMGILGPSFSIFVSGETQSHCIGSDAVDCDADPRDPHARSVRPHLPERPHLHPKPSHVRALLDGQGSPAAGHPMPGRPIESSKRDLAYGQTCLTASSHSGGPHQPRLRPSTNDHFYPSHPGTRIISALRARCGRQPSPRPSYRVCLNSDTRQHTFKR